MFMVKRERERTPFGARLFAARTHAGLSQAELGKAVGLSQGTIGEAEYTANGSGKTTKIAAVTGVSAAWLASDEGAMIVVDTFVPHKISENLPDGWAKAHDVQDATPIQPRPNIYQAITTLGGLLKDHSHLSRLSVAPLLQRLAEHPEETDEIARQIQRNLSALGNTAGPESSSSPREEALGQAPPAKTISRMA